MIRYKSLISHLNLKVHGIMMVITLSAGCPGWSASIVRERNGSDLTPGGTRAEQ